MTTERRAEGAIEWRGKACTEDGHRHSRCPFRARVASGVDPATGRRRFLYATGRGNVRAADAVVRDLLNKRDQGLDVQPKRLTTGDWLDRWLDGRIADAALSARVASNYQGIARLHLRPSLGDVRLQELRPDHILDVKVSLLAGGMAPATVRKALGLLKQSLDAAVVAGLLARNPATAVPLPSVGDGRRERRALNEAELSKILRAASGAEATMIRFAIATGVRQAEMLGLRWADVDLEAATLEVRQTLQHVKGEGFVAAPPKTRNSRRTIELSAATVALLTTHREAQDAEIERLGDVWHDHGLVFPGSDGQPRWQKVVLRGFRRVLTTAKITKSEEVNWHTLRHTAASLWIKAGVDVFTVSRRLGHSSAGFTMDTYAHILKGQQRQAAEALDHIIAAA